MSEHYVSLGLLLMLIFQQVYLTMTINRLVDKLMSRNYHEYVQSSNPPADIPVVKIDDEPVEDLNQMFGIL